MEGGLPVNITTGRPVTIARQEAERMRWMASMKNTTSVDPRIKSWIDNVIVPALVDEWIVSRASKAAA
jgi:hypothetical protein